MYANGAKHACAHTHTHGSVAEPWSEIGGKRRRDRANLSQPAFEGQQEEQQGEQQEAGDERD